MIYAVYPKAIDCGISVESFWSLTIPEIEDVMESHYREVKQKEKVKIERLFVLAEAIGTRVAFIFSDSKEEAKDCVLWPWDAYPELFSKEKEQRDDFEEGREFQEYKDARRRHAAEFNKRRREAGI